MKEIKGYEGRYSIEEDGRVWSHLTNKYLISHIKKKGYVSVVLYDSERIEHSVHRLVAKTYIPNPENKPHVNHKTGNKLKNHKDELEWVTPSENMKHAYKLGLIIPPRFSVSGEKNGKSKLTEQQVLEIRSRYENEDISLVKLSKDYPVGKSQIGDIILRKKWKVLN